MTLVSLHRHRQPSKVPEFSPRSPSEGSQDDVLSTEKKKKKLIIVGVSSSE